MASTIRTESKLQAGTETKYLRQALLVDDRSCGVERPRSSIRPVKVSAQIASLEWSRPKYIDTLRDLMGPTVDYKNKPAEDFAHATVNYVDEENNPLIVDEFSRQRAQTLHES